MNHFQHCKTADFAQWAGAAGHPRKMFERPQSFPFRFGNGRRAKYNVPMNISETGSEFLIELYATGFSKEDISITVHGDVLFIRGKKELAEGAERQFVLQEFPIKNFERTLALNGSVQSELITATSENGVLIVSLPKSIVEGEPKHSIEVL